MNIAQFRSRWSLPVGYSYWRTIAQYKRTAQAVPTFLLYCMKTVLPSERLHGLALTTATVLKYVHAMPISKNARAVRYPQ